jgi:putative transposase
MAKPFFRHPAHPPPVRRDNEPVIVLVTVCVEHRRPILATAKAIEVLLGAWRDADDWVVGTYVVMPDHVHVFCAPAAFVPPAVQRWAGYWKRLVGDREQSLRHQFQPDCWDVQMRSQEHYLRKLDYVRQNPVRKGLVTRWEDWPYQGTVQPLDWR